MSDAGIEWANGVATEYITSVSPGGGAKFPLLIICCTLSPLEIEKALVALHGVAAATPESVAARIADIGRSRTSKKKYKVTATRAAPTAMLGSKILRFLPITTGISHTFNDLLGMLMTLTSMWSLSREFAFPLTYNLPYQGSALKDVDIPISITYYTNAGRQGSI